MSQLVTQTTTYGLNSGQYSISTLSGVGGVLEIMAGNPHDKVTVPTPIADFKSDQSAKFYGTVTAPSLSITADNAKVKDKNIVRSINGTLAGEDGNVTITTVKKVNNTSPDSNGNVTVDLSGRVAVSGARGTLAGYEASGTSTTINASSPDANEVDSAITVSNGASGTSWTKIVRVTAEVTVTLGSAWIWQGGSAPTITAGGVLVCCWCGSGGIAQFVSPT